MPSIVDYYEEHGRDLSERYDRVTFEAVHCHLLEYLPPVPSDILDIGSGSGRDAIALARRRHAVTAIEPSPTMRSIAITRAEGLPIRWLDGSLPRLEPLRSEAGRYAFILCSAVIMHVARADLGAAFASMARLLSVRGHLGLTLRNALAADAPGIFQTYRSAELEVAAGDAGLTLVRSEEDQDQLGRRDLIWRTLVFRKQ